MKALGAVAVLVLASSCQASPDQMSGAQIAQIEGEVSAVGDQFMAAMNNLDVEALSALYDPSSMHGNDGTVYFATYDDWMAYIQQLFDSFQELSIEWTNTRVDVLAPNVALFVGQSGATLKRIEPGESREGYISLVLRKTDGAWKIMHQASVGRWTPIAGG